MTRIGRTIQSVLRSRPVGYLTLALVLPTLLAVPGPAGILVLHRHCGESAHLHRFGHSDLRGWHDDHGRQHSGDDPGHHDPPEPEAAVSDERGSHDTPTLVLAKEHMSRPLPSSDSNVPAQHSSACTRVAGALAVTEYGLMGGLPPPTAFRADLSSLDARAALLLRNHALLL